MIPIPSMQKSVAKPLQRCIETTAREMGCDEVKVARILSRFWEAVADEMTHGHAVRIPSFGVFAPFLMSLKRRKQSGDLRPRCVPVFQPYESLRHQVMIGAPVSREGNRIVEQVEKNRRRDKGRRVFTGQRWFREKLEAAFSDA